MLEAQLHKIIYPSRQKRLFQHLLFWLLFYVFIYFYQMTIFSTVDLTLTIIISNLSFLVCIISNHYFIFQILIPFFKRRKILSCLILFITSYILTTLISTYPLYFSWIYLGDNGVAKQYHRYGLQHWQDIFSYQNLIWTTTVVYTFNLIASLIKLTLDFYRNQQEKLIIQQERNAMEMNFLRMQIQPHFLFNSLNNIYGMVLENTQAANAITKLSDLLRFSVEGSKRDWISLKEEVSFLQDYIDLERIRHRLDKVQITYDFTNISNRNCLIKPLLLVNFIENAFKHGVNADAGKSWVKIQLKEEKGQLSFDIDNSKPGPHKERANLNKNATQKKTGVGLTNVRRRLELEYPEKHTLDIRETEETYQIQLTLTLR